MSFQGRFLEAGIESDGVNLELFNDGSQLTVKGPVFKKTTVTTEATAGDVTYTAAQILGGLILRDPAGGARADLFPTAAAIIAAMKSYNVGNSFEVTIRNTADAAETITMTTNTGLTLSGTMTIAQNNSKSFLVLVTAATTVTIYSLGTVVH